MSDLDPLIHVPARLRIMTALAALSPGSQYTFTKVRDKLDMTAGNLSTHLTKLEEAGYVDVTKTFERKTPVTYIELSHLGRAAYATYLKTLHELLATPD